MKDHTTNLFLETFKIIICAVELLLSSALLYHNGSDLIICCQDVVVLCLPPPRQVSREHNIRNIRYTIILNILHSFC